MSPDKLVKIISQHRVELESTNPGTMPVNCHEHSTDKSIFIACVMCKRLLYSAILKSNIWQPVTND